MRLRSLLCGLVFVGIAQGASAADLGDSFLRGSTVISQPGGTRWDGFYFGGQVGATYCGRGLQQRDQRSGRLHPARVDLQ